MKFFFGDDSGGGRESLRGFLGKGFGDWEMQFEI